MEDDNDEELTFVRLAAVTANVVRFLKEKQTTHGNERAEKVERRENADEQKSRYVGYRLREIREFERRARGK